ncbi:SWIM zinc finger family protein [Streptomyces sp. NPDC002680]|uniref:SWIM zinc finger family protein n=1 Tax=Streptomyces sp. NPDC002680 TaxID=3364659 RepID=UPI00369FFA40
MPGERPLPDDPGQDRPADAARRALRAARERAGQTTTSATHGAAPGAVPARGVARAAAAGKLTEPEKPGQRGRYEKPTETGEPEQRGRLDRPVEATGPKARPGDAARVALWGATASASSKPPTGATAGPGPAAPDGLDGAPDVPDAPQARTDAGDRKSGRPGDVAREALRAARGEALRARLDAEAAAAEATRRPVRPLRARDPRDRSPGDRVRDVRELLAGSFELPTDESPAAPVRDPRPAGAEPHTDPSPPVTVGEVLRAVASPTPRGDTGVEADEATVDASSDTPNPRATTEFRHVPPPLADPHDSHSDSDTSRIAPVPSSMAAPGRDGELRRTFPALRASGNRETASEGVRFAESWWGNAWVTALEEGALDAARLVRGRGYAEKGHVDAITVTPGLVLAYVQGSRPRPYRVQVRLRTLGGQEWERFLDAAVERPGHIAALLDKELPQSLADCGAPLLPGPGDLEPRCSCPDSGHPCKHAAALCYQTARLLDADPFVLLLLRGRGEREVLDELSRRNAARGARAAQEQQTAAFPGVRASDALAPHTLPPLPAPLPPRPHPEPPPAYPASPGGPDPFALDQLATDAAARAHTLLTTGHDPVGELTLWQDAVRLAAARPGSGLTAGTRALYSSLARAAGRTPADLARAVAAWRQGGLDGLEVLEEAWDPPAGRFDRARPLLRAADLPAFRPWRNHLTHPRGHIQLRLGRDGLWYAYESEPGHDDWWPRGTPDLDPVGALTGLGNPADS